MFYVKNLPVWERVLRVAAGIVASGLAWLAWPGMVGWLVTAGAVGIVITGMVGFCPMCALVGRRLDDAAPPR